MSNPDKEFDGIRQADNPMPEWWKGIFFICVLFAPIYVIYFHFFSDWHQADQLKIETAEYEKKFPQTQKVAVNLDEGNPLRGDARAIEAGHQTFINRCAACHGQDAHGVVGPNLTDKEWLHGGTDGEVYTTIMKGVNPPNTVMNRGPMPAHENALGSQKVLEVMAWLATQNPDLKPAK